MSSSFTLKGVFTKKYEENAGENKQSTSGIGSEKEFTERLRKWLDHVIEAHNIHSIVDAPCGDFNWMQHFTEHKDIHYYGVDIVEALIERNKEKFPSKNISFQCNDICEDPLPDCDLLIVRDLLIHLSFKDIGKFLTNLSSANYKYLAINTYTEHNNVANKNIVSGAFRKVNVFDWPLNFDPSTALDEVKDYPDGYRLPREMVLFAKKDVPKKLDYSQHNNSM
ncbi:class I SAM-dependent methyltransferase [Flexibacterium corallicola]|uniref:class I SAM-dependent methyltransferase n=1 Tax=Flexibacterium corallicola TaxID=3037259 RepID=UPI00286EDD51|nr:class I SAM-dependent methyltransferase [Pseudovibrio sp. M1P-2-3]